MSRAAGHARRPTFGVDHRHRSLHRCQLTREPCSLSLEIRDVLIRILITHATAYLVFKLKSVHGDYVVLPSLSTSCHDQLVARRDRCQQRAVRLSFIEGQNMITCPCACTLRFSRLGLQSSELRIEVLVVRGDFVSSSLSMNT